MLMAMAVLICCSKRTTSHRAVEFSPDCIWQCRCCLAVCCMLYLPSLALWLVQVMQGRQRLSLAAEG